MKLTEEILAQTDGTLIRPEERSFVRLILGVGEDTTVAQYTASEIRFAAMAANTFFNKAIRTLITKYGKLGDDVIALVTPKVYSSDDQRLRIALMLNNLVFPPTRQAPLEDVLTEIAERESGGQLIQSIPVRFGELSREEMFDDFGIGSGFD